MKKQIRVGVIGGGCVMCELPPARRPDDVAQSFAAAVAMSETVAGDPTAFDVCVKHRLMIEEHRDMHRSTSSSELPSDPEVAT